MKTIKATVFLLLILFNAEIFIPAQSIVGYSIEEIPLAGLVRGINNHSVVIGQQALGFYVYSNGFKSFPDLRDTIGLDRPYCLNLNNDNKILFTASGGEAYSGSRIYMFDIKDNSVSNIAKCSFQIDALLTLYILFNDHNTVLIPQPNSSGFLGNTFVLINEYGRSVFLLPIDYYCGVSSFSRCFMNNNKTIALNAVYLPFNGGMDETLIYNNTNYIRSIKCKVMGLNTNDTIMCQSTSYEQSGTTNEIYSIDYYYYNNDLSTSVFSESRKTPNPLDNNYWYQTTAAMNNNETAVIWAFGELSVFNKLKKVFSVSQTNFIYGIFINDKDEIAFSDVSGSYILKPVKSSKADFLPVYSNSHPITFKLSGPKGLDVQIQQSTNLYNWNNYQDVILGDEPISIVDSNSFAKPQNYLRINGR